MMSARGKSSPAISRYIVVIVVCAVLLIIDIAGAVAIIAHNNRKHTASAQSSIVQTPHYEAQHEPVQQDSAEQQEEAPAAPAINPITQSLENIAKLDPTAQISTVDFTLSEQLRAKLIQVLQSFTDSGYEASFTLVDLTHGRAMSSYGGIERYSASAIKGPYVLALAGTNTIDLSAVSQALAGMPAYTHQLINATITVSDNDSYDTLLETYGTVPFATWFSDLGMQADVGNMYGYMHVSSNDVARMWVRGFDYLFMPAKEGETKADPQARAWLASQFTDTLNSNIHTALSNHAATLTKGGWINGQGNYYALNDAGIVLPHRDPNNLGIDSAPQGYVMSILTNACGRNDLMVPLAQVLDEIYTSQMQ